MIKWKASSHAQTYFPFVVSLIFFSLICFPYMNIIHHECFALRNTEQHLIKKSSSRWFDMKPYSEAEAPVDQMIDYKLLEPIYSWFWNLAVFPEYL